MLLENPVAAAERATARPASSRASKPRHSLDLGKHRFFRPRTAHGTLEPDGIGGVGFRLRGSGMSVSDRDVIERRRTEYVEAFNREDIVAMTGYAAPDALGM